MEQVEQVNPNTNFINRFNLSAEFPPIGDQRPRDDHLRSRGNLTYLQLIDLIDKLWTRAHPEIEFVPMGNRNKFNAEKGYIVYSLENKKSSADNLKPRFMEDVVQTDSDNFQGAIYIQKFDHLIEFTAVHHDPRTAEEIIEAFEDFMIVLMPEFRYAGAQDIFYSRRVADRDQTRFGQDMAYRSAMYLAILQKMIIIKREVLEAVRLDVRVNTDNPGPEANEVMFGEITRLHPITVEGGENLLNEAGNPIFS